MSSRTSITWIDPEERAYNTYAGGHSRSRRRGRAVFSDGVLRPVTLGVADTYFTIPAHARVQGRYVSGFVSVNQDGLYEFTERRKPGAPVQGALR